jgi:lipoate-protein ligase A
MHNRRCLDLTLPTPAENLACDEALLDWCEACAAPGVLRFWEPRRHFVVLGYANRAGREVNLDECAALGVPVLRRCTGGGAVLQGPGCLNYSLVLEIDSAPALQSVTATNRFVMETNRYALEPLSVGAPVTVQGVTDLTLRGLKFSGNAQRRRRRCLLFHGAFLLDFDGPLMEQVLRSPTKQPAYRRHRSHQAFLTRLPAAPADIKAALQRAWAATAPAEEIPQVEIDRLAREKYSRPEWNLKW